MVVNPPLILVSALFFLALCAIFYTGAWLAVTAILRIGGKRIRHVMAKRMLMSALVLPPILAIIPTVGGATLHHSHTKSLMEHHSMLCQQMFTHIFSLSSHGNVATGVLVNGIAWITAITGAVLLARLFIATVRMEQGLAPFLTTPSPKLASALSEVALRMPKLPIDRFFECAIPAAYSSVFGLFRVRCVLSRDFVASATQDELVAVVAHEGAHLRANDVWSTLMVGAINCMFFPLRPVRLLARRWRETAELACDDAAVIATQNPLAMATAILRVSGVPVRSRHVSKALPATSLAFADDAACAPAKRVERLIAQSQSASVTPVLEKPFHALGSWAVTMLLASLGVATLVSPQAICYAHCSLEAVAKLLP
jgi:Zn-dependent protease with chaperone function